MRLDLSAKLAFVLLLWLCGFLLHWTMAVWLIPLLLFLRYASSSFQPVSARSRKAFNKFLVYGFTLTFFLLLLNGLLIRDGNVLYTLFGFPIYEEGLRFGAATGTRLLILSLSLLLFFLSTPLDEFILFLQQRGLPSPLVLVLLLTLHFLDQLPVKIQTIFVAQEARGAPVRAGFASRTRAFFSVLSPLVLSSLVESIERGLALELRGFRRTIKSTVVNKSVDRPLSSLTIFFLFLSFLLLLWSGIEWLLR